ncbi:molybdopterin converting factor subunit 1 [Burkholderia sp. Ax-1719]|uniref:molybdopterin converting factor subunit 1 n=1 Tax=Burkholderia sp. Ax-1719 TaxID=2608334 RepID=UPI00141F5651|nr:molybdopterin converting factor subunit 1 [Burkholderia sp. Ax-1719]NIE62967.1 molybdopterin converting factor subunit 1 [Burkholderia sp. Ax-1719]
MKLTIKYFASIREQIGVAQEVIEIDAPQINLAELRAQLIARNPQTADALATARPVRVAVNHEMVAGAFVDTFAVRQDSEIAFFPPVTGG